MLNFKERLVVLIFVVILSIFLFQISDIIVRVGIILHFIGVFLNYLCLGFNKGKMPVYRGQKTIIHEPFKDKKEVRLWFLSDILDLGLWKVSIGDVISLVGLGFIIKGVFGGWF
jgi:hypothetical protein